MMKIKLNIKHYIGFGNRIEFSVQGTGQQHHKEINRYFCVYKNKVYVTKGLKLKDIDCPEKRKLCNILPA